MVALLLAAALLGGGGGEDAPDAPALGPSVDGLAAWRSPVAGPVVTAGEYLLLRPVRRLRVDLDGDGRAEELLVVPFETPDRETAYSVAVLTPRGGDFESRLLLNCYAPDLRRVRVLRLRGRKLPGVLIAQDTGSGGFLNLDLFTWSGGGFRRVGLEGVYQGRYRLLRDEARAVQAVRVTRSIPGDVNASPRGSWRETYRWSGRRLALVSRTRTWRTHFARLPRRAPHLFSD